MHRNSGDRRILVALTLGALVLSAAVPAGAQQSLTISNGTAAGIAPETLDVRLDSTAPTEGYVLAIGFDPAFVAADELTSDGTVADAVGAELSIAEIFADGATLGVVLDASPPFAGQTIAAGQDQLVARLTVSRSARCRSSPPRPSPRSSSSMGS
jgi:hypothetical protein